jgi:P-type conjugative transfer protein TrbG
VKPTRAELMTNLVINTDRRTYHMELRSTPSTYMASVSWQYPQDQLIALRRQNSQAEAQQPVANGIDLSRVNFRYDVSGDRAPWRPLRAFDDGRQVFIEFPRGIGQGEMPPLFVVGPEGATSELVNYRVRGNYMIVDRLFAAAELRFGADKIRSACAFAHGREAGVVSNNDPENEEGREPEAGRPVVPAEDDAPADGRAGRADAAAPRAAARHAPVAQGAGRSRSCRQCRCRRCIDLRAPDPSWRRSGSGTDLNRQPHHAGWPRRTTQGL